MSVAAQAARLWHTRSSSAFSPIVLSGDLRAMSVESRKGFEESDRPLVVGRYVVGFAELGGPVRFLKGLLDRRWGGPRSDRRR